MVIDPVIVQQASGRLVDLAAVAQRIEEDVSDVLVRDALTTFAQMMQAGLVRRGSAAQVAVAGSGT